MSIWTVKPEELTIDLTFVDSDNTSHEFWIKVKKRLNVGEERRVMTAGWKSVSQQRTVRGGPSTPEVQIDWKQQAFARVDAYLTDWSLADDERKKLPLSLDTICSLRSDVFDIIESAINQHVEAMAEEKKVPNGSAAPSAT